MFPIALGVGFALQAIGSISSNMSQARAEKANARSYEQQAAYAREVNKRKMALLGRQQKDFLGKQRAAFAASGISFSGSVIDVVVDTQIQQELEMEAAQMEAEQTVMQYTSRAESSRSNASTLSNPLNNLLPIAGNALSTIGQYQASKDR